MFRSARLKLTLFYLAVLVVFSLVVSFSIRVLAEREYLRSNGVQRGEVRQLILGFSGQPDDSPYFSVQRTQEDLVRQRLNEDMIAINIVALIVSGALSYWFAGRTLKPIEEAHEAQTRFATDASHELRTPLTNLKLENEVFLRQRHFGEDEARQLIESNLEEVQRLEGLSSNLLALTQYGTAALELGSVNMQDAAGAAVKQNHRAAAAKHITVRCELQPALVRGHQDSLVQLVGILLDNAIKYGSAHSEVLIGGQLQDGQYLLWVQDHGPGIADGDLPHIFDRLYRGDKARSSKVGGYGLGLSLAKAIVAANHGEIRVQNMPTGGACFMVRMPLAK